MKRILGIFCVKREERWLSLVMLLAFVALNALVIIKYYNLFTPLNNFYWPLFVRNFHIAGFDPITYAVVSDWSAGYNVYRHPLLAFYMYIPYLLNQGLIQLTGINCAIFIVASMQIFCAFYSLLFIYRIFREVVCIRRFDATLLSVFFFSFAYVMLSLMAPDHFIISLMLLLLALYISGKRMIKKTQFKIWQSILYFLLTAGTSLNNGLKIFLSGLFTNGKQFFRPKYLLLAVIMPAALIWGVSRLEYAKLVWPQEMARHATKAKKKAAQQKAQQAKTIQMQLLQARNTNKTQAKLNKDKDTAKVKAPVAKKKQSKQGTPISNGEFMRWTDISTSRTATIFENLFGESIQLHKDHLLEDVLRSRPVIVRYNHIYNYVAEGLICLLFLLGIVCGCRSRFFWLVMSYAGLDLLLHIGLGFAINEVYIMSCHWIYVIPITIAFLFKNINSRVLPLLRVSLLCLTTYLWVNNVWLITSYLL